MTADRREGESAHELRLEGIGLLLGGGVLLALLVGAFLLGRWVERREQPPTLSAAESRGPLSQMVREPAPAEAEEGLTHFDTLQGEQQEAEPGREIPASAPPRAPAPPPDPAPPRRSDARDAADLPHFVQVIALRDQQAAAVSIRKLEQQGYPVRLFTEREGGGTLYKVRVGGFATEGEARDAAARLRDGGYPGAFVTTKG